MNRRQKIIVSVTGIFIVLLVLLGLTYAYFLTRITGNGNPTSISVTTANLELVYQDSDASIIGSGKLLEPDSNNPIGTKTFTVTNNGNATVESYAVIIENLAVKYVSSTESVQAGEVTNLVNGEDGEPDMKLVITCKSYTNYGTGNQEESGTCNGMDGYLPEKSDILLINSIDKDITHEYTATLTYLDDGTNQSDDMNKTITGKFNIIDTKNTVDITGTVENYTKGDKVTINSEYKESVIYSDGTYKLMGVKPDIHTIKVSTNEIGKVSIKGGTTASTTGTTIVNGTTIPEITITAESRVLTINLTNTVQVGTMTNIPKQQLLADVIIDNIKNGTLEGKTTFSANLDATGMVDNISSASDKILSTANDDYTESTGKQSYYFRGNPIDNYVEFAGMCWRIVRIQGDGSIKLILASELSCSEDNLTNNSGYATNGARGAKGTMLYAVHYGYKMIGDYYINDYINSPENNSTSARTQLNAWLDRKITSEEQQKYLKDENWCIGDLTNAYSFDDTGEIVETVDELISSGTIFNYTAGYKSWVTKTPSYICETTGKTGEIDTNKVGMLTFDEIVYAGGGNSSNSNYYLNNNATTDYWWSLSPRDFGTVVCTDSSFVGSYDGGIEYRDVSYYDDDSFGLRVAVSLKSSVVFKDGDGTLEKPYILG